MRGQFRKHVVHASDSRAENYSERIAPRSVQPNDPRSTTFREYCTLVTLSPQVVTVYLIRVGLRIAMARVKA